MVWPYGIARSPAQTLRWNSVPAGASGRLNSVSSPAKYADSWAAAVANGPAALSPGTPSDSAAGACRCAFMYRPVIMSSVATMVSGPTGLGTVTCVRRMAVLLLVMTYSGVLIGEAVDVV